MRFTQRACDELRIINGGGDGRQKRAEDPPPEEVLNVRILSRRSVGKRK